LRGTSRARTRSSSHLASGVGVLAVFHGPHGYVSPSVYVEQPSVPTWNYVVVHARGRPRIVGRAKGCGRSWTTRWRASTPPGGASEDDDYEFLRMLGAIAGFEIEIASLEGKWKLSQNRSPGTTAPASRSRWRRATRTVAPSQISCAGCCSPGERGRHPARL
jgi:predicted FMN-binding regulatory protein PaiB